MAFLNMRRKQLRKASFVLLCVKSSGIAVQIAVYLYSNKNNFNLKALKFTTEILSYKIQKQYCSNSIDIKTVNRHLLVHTEQSEMH